MLNEMNWPTGEFTIQELISLNPKFKEPDIREALAQRVKAKAIVQTLKGNGKVKGKFQVKPAS